MASSGSSGRAPSGSRSFDFGSDDVLGAYDDYASNDPSNGKRLDPSGKDLHDSRMGRPLVNIYEHENYSKEEIISAVEKCMKKYADNLLRSLEGIGGRLSQLEIHCYKLERSIGELRNDFSRDQSETDLKYKSLEKHLQEVHRSIQILRDKQEIAETQKELAKLQLAHKESAQKTEEAIAPPSASEPKKQHDDKPEASNQHLALVLSRQATVPHSLPPRASDPIQPYKEPTLQQTIPAHLGPQQDRYILNQASAYYPQSQPMQPELQYIQTRPPQTQDIPVPLPPQQPSQVISQAQTQTFPQYHQQQWPQPPSQQFPPQVMQPQQPNPNQLPPQVVQQHQSAPQTQIRPQTPPSYPPYQTHQPANPNSETFSGSMAMPVSYAAIPQQRPQPPPSSQGSFGPPMSKTGYMGPAPYTPQVSAQGFNSAYSYSASNVPAVQTQQLMRNHPYGEFIEKAVVMGYSREQVASVVQRMADSGQPIDFNAVLDRLNGGGGAASQRVWSG
ncbi:hypothetical protein ACMD2_12116 [Ananas comosus]|uniref:DUF1421 domain-containing protein n=1 Tax=Ananas comosus TaxID=4615 RepID=A0A199UEU2_ANACO|nr:hypothetical protein ACMD2_12116 [Ananas comosus]